MTIIQWVSEKPKTIIIQMEGVSATLHLKENQQVTFTDKVWDKIKDYFTDDIEIGNAEILVVEDTKKKQKLKNKKDEDIMEFFK